MDDESESIDGPSPKDFILAGWDLQNRRQPIKSSATRKRAFRDFFSARASVVCLLWHLPDRHDLLPDKSKIEHLLWTLYFFKAYTCQSLACTTVGSSNGAVDPKTFRKWVWRFVFGIADLKEVVVSF